MPNRIRVFLVDAPMLFRRCLASALSRRRRLEIIGEAATGSEALAAAPALRPDVVVVDPDVPEGGQRLIADLCQEVPACSLLVLTVAREEGAVGRALQAGARGYLEKNCDVGDLVRSIERVRAGELVVAPGLADSVGKDLTASQTAEPRGLVLTAREVEVLRLVALGQTNSWVARELFITDHTVKAHLAKILGKLGLENRVQLATYAMQHGLLAPGDAAPTL